MQILPPPTHLFFSKQDPEDKRLGEWAQFCSIDSLPSHGVALFGYPDDEGIQNNGGRVGASFGPDSIRDRFYRMTPSAFQLLKPLPPICDLGNLSPVNESLGNRHSKASLLASAVLRKNLKWIGLGGGHDYGFPDGDGFLNVFSTAPLKPIIINFDAHLDVRPLSQGKITSGTPFRRLLENHSGKFDFVEIGLQSFCNSPHHFQWLNAQGGKVLTLDEMRNCEGHPKDFLRTQLNNWGFLIPGRPCFISVDIDVFQSSSAMGCSQSWPSGLTPKEFFGLFEFLCHTFSVHALGIYEVSPPLDQDHKTSQLAAEILHRFLYY
jgi:formiminoglutamase